MTKATNPAVVTPLSDDLRDRPSPQLALTSFSGPARRPAFLQPDASVHPRTALSRSPLVPSEVLRDHHCHISTDTRFRSAARLLQSLHRTDAGLAVGVHLAGNPKRPTRIQLGSRLPADAARAGHNFISPAVHALVLLSQKASVRGG